MAEVGGGGGGREEFDAVRCSSLWFVAGRRGSQWLVVVRVLVVVRFIAARAGP